MFEGKHIHFSPIDQKPLCSFSTKLCRQRRLNGYAFCIRHILEDPSAPFHLCSYVASSGQSKCTNVISNTHPRGLCNTHLQMAGFPAAKRERRHHKKERSHISMSSPPDSSKVQSVEPTSSSMEMSDGDPYTFSDDGDHNQAVEASYENDKKSPCAGSPPQSSPLAVEPLTPSSTSSSSAETEINIYKKKSTGGNPPVQNVSKIKLMKFDFKPSKKRKGTGKPNDKAANCRLPAILQQLDDSMHQSKSPKYLLPDKIQDCEDESDAASYCPLPRYVTAYLAAENTRRRNFQLKEKSNEMRRQYLQLTKMMEAEQKYFDRRQNVLTKKLLQAARCCPDETALLLQGRKLTSGSSLTDASSNRHIFTKHKCSFVAKHKEKSDASCSEFALPCSTLCSRHILYSVDQQLFEFCSARTPSGSPPCGAPVLSIHSGLPCCATHTNINNSSKNSGIESTDSSTVNGIGSQSGAGGIGSNKSSRRKARSRSSSLGRHSRRLRNRRRAIKSTETRIHCIEASDNGMELDVETVDSPENCSPAYPTPAQLIPVAVPTAPVGAAAVPSLDHEAEILEDHDLKELLNRLPDEAFQEIFSMTQVASSVSRNGGLFVPSREEAEELERALAEEVPIAIANENDLSDLSLIDDHTLALAHDLVMGAGAVAQNLLLATAETASSTNMFMDHNVLDNLNIPHHPTVTNTETVQVTQRMESALLGGEMLAEVSRLALREVPAHRFHTSLNSHGNSFLDESDSAAHPL